MSLFAIRKPTKRNFRKKQVTENEDEDGEEEKSQKMESGAAVDSSKAKNKTAPLASSEVPRSLLSFEDELETEGDIAQFRNKKANRARRLAKMEEKQRAKKQREAALSALRRQESSGTDSEKEEEEEEAKPFTLSQRLNQGYIPDAAMIHAARKRREVARQVGTHSSDYMSLSASGQEQRGGGWRGRGVGMGEGEEGGGEEEAVMARGRSRLVREDDHDKSDVEDDGPTMSFGELQGPSRQLEVLTALEQAGEVSEDEEMKLYEEEQMNRGVKAISLPSSEPALSLHQQQQQQLSLTDQSFLYGSSAYPGYPPPPPPPPPGGGGRGYVDPFSSGTTLPEPSRVGLGAVPPLPENLVPITLDSLEGQLHRHLEELREARASHAHQLERVVEELVTCDREIQRVGGHSGGVSEEYKFYQELRGYLRDLLSCLAQKSPVVEQLNKSMLAVWRRHSSLVAERRKLDREEEGAELEEGVVLEPSSPAELARKRRAAEREGRRRRRRERREKAQDLSAGGGGGGGGGGRTSGHNEGFSSDDELMETDRLKLLQEEEKLTSKAKELFSDVVNDFCDLSIVKHKLEQWKFSFPKSYQEAFISLCLTKLFAPFVKLQLLNWNPLESGCPSMEDMDWFRVLMFYGYENGTDPDPSDQDLELIPQLVEKVVVPKLTALLQVVWDPLSSSQTQRAVQLIQCLADDYPTVSFQSQVTQNMFSVILQRLRTAIETEVSVPLFSQSQLENESSPHSRFFQRQFWSCVKLLGNVTAWSALVSPETLQELALDRLLNRHLLLFLQNSPSNQLSSVGKAATVLAKLPEAWFSEGVMMKVSLQGMDRYLEHLAEALDRSSIGHSDMERKKTKVFIEQIADMRQWLQHCTD